MKILSSFTTEESKSGLARHEVEKNYDRTVIFGWTIPLSLYRTTYFTIEKNINFKYMWLPLLFYLAIFFSLELLSKLLPLEPLSFNGQRWMEPVQCSKPEMHTN